MKEVLDPVVVSYEQFLERRGRRRRVAAELIRQQRARTIVGEVRAAQPVDPAVTDERPRTTRTI